MTKLGNSPKVLGLDISTKTIGWALFDIQSRDLLELTHFSPKIKPKPEDKLTEMMAKVDQFKEKMVDYKNVGITKIVIEEPLINSNNIRTVAILMRYNSFITRVIYDVLGILPEYISTYDSRKFAFPTLYVPNNKGKKVLFGGYDKGCDKKHIVKKENYDMCDAYTCVLGQMSKSEIW